MTAPAPPTTRYLYLRQVENQHFLYLLKNPTLKFSTTDLTCQYRVSPIYPVLPEKCVDPILANGVYAGFFFYEHAFYFLGHLVSALPNDLLQNLWFSHGLASIIIFANDVSKLENISKDYSNGLKALECWEICNHKIENVSIKPGELASPTMSMSSLHDFSGLDSDFQGILTELQNCLHTAAARSSRFMPGLLLAFTQITEAVNEIIDELLFLQNPTTPPPPSLPKDIPGENSVNRQRRIHQRTGQLVQLNSQLSYVISQAFSGMPPILENECQIRSYSLLGVGTAFQAISAFSRHVEKIFEKFPVDKVVFNDYEIAPGIEIFRRIGLFNPDLWAQHRGFLDSRLAKTDPELFKPKLVAFSGRQGFRETEAAVTVALPVLSSSDTARWSIMTLSHELIHGKVRSLLGTIFSDSEGRSLNQAFIHYYKSFSDLCMGKLTPDKITLRESLRFIIFNYCIHKQTITNAFEHRNEDLQDIYMPLPEILLKVLAAEYREINEIMAQVLDYNYFYNCNNELYLGLLWASWTPVPAVLENLERYLLRSIITVATNETGTPVDRFNLSINIVKEALNRLADRRPNNLVAKQALTVLDDQDSVIRLKSEFYSGFYLAEMTKNFLVSTHIHAALIDDQNLDVDSEQKFIYRIETGKFPGVQIESPVAFVADRLWRVIKGEDPKSAQEHRSCWLLLACASSFS